ncbi:HAD hydrolase family protein [Aminipila sp.]|uniref:HAD hydrolase family protein n=1 Tax=Aminipila sp. TaxID=2060095 RepID=UPI0028967DF8|nr:HAD hydrolase family protein [Aminipila sp.]
MKIFCSDLDNTLIYSYKHDIGKDKVLVECMGGKELSYMTTSAHNLLIDIASDKMFVPITTRSLAQYSRIDFGRDISIKYALVSNGGILLEEGKINEEWLAESRKIAKDAEEELEKGIQLLKNDPNVYFEVKKADDLFIFTKSNDSYKTIEQLKLSLNTEKVYIDKNGVKVYIFPKILDKGSSIQRLRNYISGDYTFISAGDSKFDIPMIEKADIGICPKELEEVNNVRIKKFSKLTFTEDMLKYVKEC